MKMTNQEVNKFLTEKVFDECWHEFKDSYSKCLKCGSRKYGYPSGVKEIIEENDYFTNEDCMTLWLKIQTLGNTWDCMRSSFCMDFNLLPENSRKGKTFLEYYVHPDRLALAVYEFLDGS